MSAAGPRGAGAPEGVAGGLIGWGPALTPCRALLAAHVAVAVALARGCGVVWAWPRCAHGRGCRWARPGGRGLGARGRGRGWAWPPLRCTWLLQLPPCRQSPPYPWEPRCPLADRVTSSLRCWPPPPPQPGALPGTRADPSRRAVPDAGCGCEPAGGPRAPQPLAVPCRLRPLFPARQ